ncbi:MAG: RNA-guided pseudouridylation complex pseudouridine synthase subunit Cbf5, partial [Candidatus Altiarchaeales archaeon]|nr:RNA-guided pseudouridylation complex pseudouridine synthase subunit Cbf5 [Candidatus Altiarchaeales archaeon]
MGQTKNICVKDESETNPKYGCTPLHRPIDEYVHKGFLVLDKPAGPTSHQAVAWVKEIFSLKKAGHSGTLDPKVTGVLPTALAESTKVLQALFGAEKQYVCLMKLH